MLGIPCCLNSSLGPLVFPQCFVCSTCSAVEKIPLRLRSSLFGHSISLFTNYLLPSFSRLTPTVFVGTKKNRGRITFPLLLRYNATNLSDSAHRDLSHDCSTAYFWYQGPLCFPPRSLTSYSPPPTRTFSHGLPHSRGEALSGRPEGTGDSGSRAKSYSSRAKRNLARAQSSESRFGRAGGK